MRILLDANIGVTIASGLSDAGHDVQRIALVDPRATDPTVLRRAISDNWIIITRDRDFGALMFAGGSPHPPAIIYIRAKASETLELIPRLLAALEDKQLLGHMMVIRATHSRRTPFP